MNQYEPLDLGAFSPDLSDDTIQILRNPTRGFRQRFLPSVGQDFIACCAEILDCKPEEIDALFANYDASLFTWLFVPVRDDDGAWILPYVYEIWDRATETTIKKLRSPSLLRDGIRDATPQSQSQST